jgi:transposase-like protein
MDTNKRHRFSPDIISYAVWLYYRFNLSHRRCAGPFIENLLTERGITVSREAIRLWCIKFGAIYARRLKRKHRGYGATFYIDEVFVKINGKQHYLWWAVDQDGEVVDVIHDTSQYANNRAEQSHEPTRVRLLEVQRPDSFEAKGLTCQHRVELCAHPCCES